MAILKFPPKTFRHLPNRNKALRVQTLFGNKCERWIPVFRSQASSHVGLRDEVLRCL